MTAKEACRPIRRSGSWPTGTTSPVAWPRAAISVLTHGSDGPRIALVYERKIVDCDGPRLCVC